LEIFQANEIQTLTQVSRKHGVAMQPSEETARLPIKPA
jgi:hypothetical protein